MPGSFWVLNSYEQQAPGIHGEVHGDQEAVSGRGGGGGAALADGCEDTASPRAFSYTSTHSHPLLTSPPAVLPCSPHLHVFLRAACRLLVHSFPTPLLAQPC